MAFVEEKDKLVQLTYSFMFSRRDNIWNHIVDFEHDLADFFKSKGLEAEPLNFIEGSTGNRTLFLRNTAKTMELRNDKNQMQTQNMPKKMPEKSYGMTRRLVSQMKQGYDKGGK